MNPGLQLRSSKTRIKEQHAMRRRRDLDAPVQSAGFQDREIVRRFVSKFVGRRVRNRPAEPFGLEFIEGSFRQGAAMKTNRSLAVVASSRRSPLPQWQKGARAIL